MLVDKNKNIKYIIFGKKYEIMDVFKVALNILLLSIILGRLCSTEIKVITKAFESRKSDQVLYCKLNKENLEQTHFIFEVKSCKEARIILAERYDSLRPSTEVIINKYQKEARIRICTSNPCNNLNIFRKKSGRLLNCTSFQPFWISWLNNISFGKGLVVGQNEIISHNLTNLVNHVGLQTISNITEAWIVYQDRIVLNTEGDDNCVAIKNYSQATAISSEDTELRPWSQSKNAECECKCFTVPDNPWKHLVNLNLTFDETKAVLKESLEKLKMNIKVNPRKTTRYNTTKTCAPDDRLSATVAGWIGGFIIALVPALAIISDVFKYCV